MISGDIGFDRVLEKPIIYPNSVGVSYTGDHIVSSAHQRHTFLEHVDNDGMEPVKLLPVESDTIGFFGRNVDLVAIASGSTLRIFHLYKMEILATIKIRPGTLHVPPSGRSGVIGMVSPQGQTFTIDDNLQVKKAALNVGEGFHVLWSSNVNPVGYMWNDEEHANIYIRSRVSDKGSTFSSSYGFTLFTVYANPHLERHEAYIVTKDEQNILKRISSSATGAVIEEIEKLPEGSVITDVVVFPDGKPSVISAIHDAENISRIISADIEEPDDVSKLLKQVTGVNTRNTSAQCVGMSSFISWSQTPVTSPVAAVTNYNVYGRPRHEVRGMKTPGQNIVPATNILRKIKIADKQYMKYRFVSPLPTIKNDMLDNVAIITDDQGFCAAGAYSPTVRMLYEMGYGVAILPTRKYGKRKFSIDDYALDIVDVTIDLVSSLIAKNVTIIATGELSKAAVKALQHRKSEASRVIVVDPVDDLEDLVKRKYQQDVIVVKTTDDQIDESAAPASSRLFHTTVSSQDPEIVKTLSEIITT